MKKLMVVAALLMAFGSCYNDKSDKLYPAPVTATCDTAAVSFSTDIMPILVAGCNISGGCHDAAGQPTSGYDFSTYAGIQPVANYEVLVNDINGTPTARHNVMPKTGTISSCDKNKITAWVNQGSKNN
jgi:hypothetical protein